MKLAVLLLLAVSLVMVSRAQVGGDQYNLLRGGWALAHDGRLIPHGNPLSNGGSVRIRITSPDPFRGATFGSPR